METVKKNKKFLTTQLKIVDNDFKYFSKININDTKNYSLVIREIILDYKTYTSLREDNYYLYPNKKELYSYYEQVNPYRKTQLLPIEIIYLIKKFYHYKLNLLFQNRLYLSSQLRLNNYFEKKK